MGLNKEIYLIDCTLGYVATGKTDHTDYFSVPNAANELAVQTYNLVVGSGNLLPSMSTCPNNGYISFSKYGGVEGADSISFLSGKLEHDSTGGETGGHCIKLSPLSSVQYLDTSKFIDSLPMFQVPAQDGVSRTVYIKLKKTADLDSTNVSIGLFMNGTLVDGWDTCAGLSSSAYTEYSLNYTPTEDGVLDFAIKLDGDTGSLYVDGFRWT